MSTKIDASLIGHKGRCFDLRLSSDDSLLISASEDGNSKIWNLSNNKCIVTLNHNKDAEVLRSCFLGSDLACTSGADGYVKLWKFDSSSGSKDLLTALPHPEGSQIYACESLEPIDDGMRLLSAADDSLYLWDPVNPNCIGRWVFESENESFGGDRNPNNDVFIFDAKKNPSDETCIGVALSDSTLRMVDLRNNTSELLFDFSADANMKLGHITSINWCTSNHHLLITFGSGMVAHFDTRQNQIVGLLKSHQNAAFGGMYVDNSDNKCITWSSDMTIRYWDLNSRASVEEKAIFENNVIEEISMSTKTISLERFPILCCALNYKTNAIYCGGGAGGNNSFVGTPICKTSAFW